MLAMSMSGELTSDYNETKDGLTTTKKEAEIATAENECEDDSSMGEPESSEYFGTLFYEESRKLTREEANSFIPEETDAAEELELGEHKENEVPATDTTLEDIDRFRKPTLTDVSLPYSAVFKPDAPQAQADATPESTAEEETDESDAEEHATPPSMARPKHRKKNKHKRKRAYAPIDALTWDWQARQALQALDEKDTRAAEAQRARGHFRPRDTLELRDEWSFAG